MADEVTTGQETTETPAPETLLTEQTTTTTDTATEVQTETTDAKAAEEEVYTLELPDGMTVDEAAFDEFVPVAKELKLKSADVQKLAPFYQKAVAYGAKQAQEALAAEVNQWAESTRSDKEIGGASLPDTLASARVALSKYGTEALTKELTRTGMGNHPELIRIFARIGKAMSEDTHVAGGTATAPDPVKVMYPTMA